MEQNNIPMEQVMAFAQSPAGRQLIRLLQSRKDTDLNKAAQQAASGNTTAAKDTLSSLLADPAVQALLKQFGG